MQGVEVPLVCAAEQEYNHRKKAFAAAASAFSFFTFFPPFLPSILHAQKLKRQLIEAAFDGDTSTVSALISAKAAVDETDEVEPFFFHQPGACIWEGISLSSNSFCIGESAAGLP